MKLLKHGQEKQCTGVSDCPCFLISATICCPLNLIHRQCSGLDGRTTPWHSPNQARNENKLCLLGTCFYWKKPFRVGRNRNMIEIFHPKQEEPTNLTCTSPGYCFSGSQSTGQVSVSIYQDLSAVVRSQIRGDTVLPKTQNTGWPIIQNFFSERLWYANSFLAAPILHQKTVDNNHSSVNEKQFAISSE